MVISSLAAPRTTCVWAQNAAWRTAGSIYRGYNAVARTSRLADTREGQLVHGHVLKHVVEVNAAAPRFVTDWSV